VLADLHAAGEREREQRAALEERLQAVAALTYVGRDEIATDDEPQAEAATEHEEQPADAETTEAPFVADEPAEARPAESMGGDADQPVPADPTVASPVGSAETAEADAGEAAADQPTVARFVPETPVDVPAQASKPSGGRRRRFRKGTPFVDRPGKCVVCSKAYQAESHDELAESGWVIRHDGGLCDTCQSDGWAYPEGAALPLRVGAEQS
jgi:hypothetical protein